jgi:hypothetical protein
MKQNINLLRTKEKISEREIRLRRFLQVGSSLLLVFYVIIVGALFSFRLIQDRESHLVGEKINQTKSVIKSLKKTESLQITLKERLKALTALFKEGKIDYKDILVLLEDLTPTGVAFESIGFNKEGEIDITGSAENSLVLGEFLTNLAEPEKELKNIVLSSLRLVQEGKYEFSLKLLLEVS